MNDPKELPGLAHFCEHTVFLGNGMYICILCMNMYVFVSWYVFSAKFNEENGFLKYLTQNGGDRNAATDHDSTVYYFTVSPNALEGALDR